jgi:hypothetical protein
MVAESAHGIYFYRIYLHRGSYELLGYVSAFRIGAANGLPGVNVVQMVTRESEGRAQEDLWRCFTGVDEAGQVQKASSTNSDERQQDSVSFWSKPLKVRLCIWTEQFCFGRQIVQVVCMLSELRKRDLICIRLAK